LESFFDGFGIRPETIGKIKEMGFTGKTFMSNVDELLTLLDSIKQHCHLTLGEEWGIKGAAKKWQKGRLLVFSPVSLMIQFSVSLGFVFVLFWPLSLGVWYVQKL